MLDLDRMHYHTLFEGLQVMDWGKPVLEGTVWLLTALLPVSNPRSVLLLSQD